MNRNDAFALLEKSVHTALETYSNVHRGSGHFSEVTTHLYEKCRTVVLDYLDLETDRYSVIFCNGRRAGMLKALIKPDKYRLISSGEIGLPLGVWALAVMKNSLPSGIPFHSGGGTTRLISRDWVIWADAPDKFEAGTPAIINVITFARTLTLIRQCGFNPFTGNKYESQPVDIIQHGDETENISGKSLLEEIRESLTGGKITVPTMHGAKRYINLDNAASTPAFSQVWDSVRKTWKQPVEIQKEIVTEVRSECALFLGAPQDSYKIVFTSNTTEAINLVAESQSLTNENDTVILTTLLEHSSNDLPWRRIPGSSLIRLSVDDKGFVDMNELESLLDLYNHKRKYGRKRIHMVAVSGASNVLGIFNNLDEISRIVHHYGAYLLVDAAQMVAHRKINMEESAIDFLAFSAHKVYAPFGCGVLVARRGLLHFSDTEMEEIRSSGEENTGGIAGLGKALLLLKKIGMDLIQQEEGTLTRHLLNGLLQIKDLTLYGVKNPDSPDFSAKGGVFVFALENKISSQVANELARYGIGTRYGCHCAHILIKHLLKVSPGLEKFQRIMLTLIPSVRLPGLVRVSLGIQNTREEIDTFLQVLAEIAGHKVSVKRNHDLQNGNGRQTKKRFRHAMNEFIRNAEQQVFS